ncbi:MAG TPA: class I SAM-dependent methyltransferase [Acidobacteriaceae bacterium]
MLFYERENAGRMPGVSYCVTIRAETAIFVTSLDKLKNTWEGLAERDALSAILTDDNRTGGRWNLAEFMATGDAEIETVLNHLAKIGHAPDTSGVALDFGCGVGRLTQALARRFSSCAGVDISEHMIRQAESLNQYPNCRYLASSAVRLPFENASFHFIYSNIVLQHVPRQLAVSYLREFVRLLAPGGVLVFGVQDSFAAPDLSSRMTRLRHIIHLRSRIRVALRRSSGDMQMHCLSERIVRCALGSVQIVDIQFTNTAARDFNGRLVYLEQPPIAGYIGKQYCAVAK